MTQVIDRSELNTGSRVCLMVTLLAIMTLVIRVPSADAQPVDTQTANASDSTRLVEVELVSAREIDPSVEDFDRVVRDAIQVVLERRGFTVLRDRGDDRPERVRTDSGPAEAVPVRLRYEYALTGFLPRLHVSVTARDPDAGTRIASSAVAARANITLYSALDELLATIDPAVDAYLAVRDDRNRGPWPVQLADSVVVSTVPTDREPPWLVERYSGEPFPGRYMLALGADVPLRVGREGYYPQEILFPVTEARPEVPVPELRPQRRYAVQLHYGHPRMAGASFGGRYYVLPDTTYLGLELGLSMSGFFEVTPSQLLHLDPRLVLGFAPWGRQERLLQPVFSSGIGTVATFTTYGDEPIPPYVDWYWNIVNASLEIGRRRLRGYLRMGFSFYSETDRGLWESGLNTENLTPEAVAGTVWRW